MASKIVDELVALDPGAESSRAFLEAKWTAICTGMINEMITAAIIKVTVSGGSSAGDHAGIILS